MKKTNEVKVASVRIDSLDKKFLNGFKNQTEAVRLALQLIRDVMNNKVNAKKLEEYKVILSFQKK